MEIKNESYCIYITDCKKTPDGTIVPREGICSSGVDYEKRYITADGTQHVLAHTVVTYMGNVLAFGYSECFDSDQDAVYALAVKNGLSVISE